MKEAIRGQLDIIALTDHDLTTHLAPGVHRHESQSVYVIHGAEITGTHEGKEYHLLVYFQREAPSNFVAFCAKQTAERRKRFESARKSINLPGIRDADYFQEQGTLALTRHHLAQAIVAAGHARTIDMAFRNHITRDVVPLIDVSFLECIDFARQCGGLTSWAHPPIPACQSHAETFARAGLVALEAHRPKVSARNRRFYRDTARKHNLLLTGGSDWHGWKDPDLGLFYVPQRDLQPFFNTLWSTPSA